MILTLKTDNPEAEIGIYKSDEKVIYHKWLADRTLTKTLLKVIEEQLEKAGGDWKDIKGVIVFKGPGSFTGLRIGITVANAIAYGQNVPVVGELGESWIIDGLQRVKTDNDKIVLPHYGGEPNISIPRK